MKTTFKAHLQLKCISTANLDNEKQIPGKSSNC